MKKPIKKDRLSVIKKASRKRKKALGIKGSVTANNNVELGVFLAITLGVISVQVPQVGFLAIIISLLVIASIIDKKLNLAIRRNRPERQRPVVRARPQKKRSRPVLVEKQSFTEFPYTRTLPS